MLKHTPYANEAEPFDIGLTPLDLVNWIEVDNRLPAYLNEKHRLMGEIPQQVFAADRTSESSQEVILKLVIEHLLIYFPDIYTHDGNIIRIKGVEHQVDLDDFTVPPLINAAMLVQEDLVIMRREADGWRFVAGSVCFPSSWILREKIGKLMHEVHGPVPDYSKDSRNAGMVERIFDNLQVMLPVERFNWSVYNNDKLYQGGHSGDHTLDKADAGDDYFLRVEHQTLRKLPDTNDILFTIRIHMDPMDMLAKRDDRRDIVGKFVKTIEAMSDEQTSYKGLAKRKRELIAKLKEIAA